MKPFNAPVESYMATPVESATADTSLRTVAADLVRRQHSSCPVVDDTGQVLGVMSYSGLLRVGGTSADPAKPLAMALPDKPVAEFMSHGAKCVAADDSVRTAAACMVEHGVHRVYVISNESALVGVLSCLDLMRAVRDARIEAPLSQLMSAPVLYTVKVDAPIGAATERLRGAQVSGLIVVDDEGWAVGTYSQREALEALRWPAGTTVERVMSYRVSVMPARTPLHRAAGAAHANRMRRIAVSNHSELVGILSGMDFAKFIANS